MGDPSASDPRSHLLHLGTRALFLDHERRLRLTEAQVEQLLALGQAAALELERLDGESARIEEQIWLLTAVTPLDSKALDALLERAAEKEAERRLVAIGAVSRASQVLTEAQIELLVGGS